MKRLLVLCFAFATILMLGNVGTALAVAAPYTYNFDDWTPGPTVNGNGILVSGWTNWSAGYYTPSYSHGPGKSVKFTGVNAGNNYIVSPAVDNGDSLKVWLFPNSTSLPAGLFRIYASTNGGTSWTLIRDCTFGAVGSGADIQTNIWNETKFKIPAPFNGVAGVTFKFIHELKTTANIGLDDVTVTSLAASSETDARLAVGGSGAYASISSMVVASPGQTALTFNVQDDGSGAASLNTTVLSLQVSAGAGNTATGWDTYLAGATLSDGINTWTGAITSTSITFTGAPLAVLPDGGAWQTWTMNVWLKTTLPYNADNKIFEFVVAPGGFTTAPTGAGFVLTDPAVSSGPTNNRVDIIATRLSITTQPPAIASKDTPFLLRAGFTDMFGGIDNDFNEAITMAVNSGTGALSSAQGLTVVSTAGQSAWSGVNGLSYDKIEIGVVLNATSPTYPSPVLTNAFTVWYAPSIVCDVAPTCWDKDSSDQAIPFALHITISNWLAEANHNVYVKMYDPSGANPWQYANGVWSKATAYTAKPIVTLDANGSWAGWLPFKSKGMASFKARAADVTTTATNLTAATTNTITGTLLEFNPTPGPVTGAILEDLTGYTRCTPGNVVLVKNGAGTVVGSWFAEDNGLPLDDGGLTIASGGFRLAVCPMCGETVTYESWEPASWPGAGTPDYTQTSADFCVVAGETKEIADIILPVQLTSAIATPGDGSVTLAWTTASETSNLRFEILRDGQLVKTVDGAVSSSSARSYSWTDNGLNNGTSYRYTLRSVSVNGESYELKALSATPSLNAMHVTEYALLQNYPNPFNPSTSIGFDLVKSGFVSLKVYNLMGQEVAKVVNGNMSEGRHIVNFDASSLSSGIYLYRIEANGFSAEKKMLLMK